MWEEGECKGPSVCVRNKKEHTKADDSPGSRLQTGATLEAKTKMRTDLDTNRTHGELPTSLPIEKYGKKSKRKGTLKT